MVSAFKSIPAVVPEGKVGVAAVEHFTVGEIGQRMYAFHGDGISPGKYARLLIHGDLYMSDTDMEHRTNWQIVHKAHGRVLIAGLGLGLILTAILDKPEVDGVTVIEKYQDVIDLVAPHHQHPKLNIICDDIFDWKPAKDERFDVAYFDIWPNICTDNLKEMATLHRRFAHWMNKNNPRKWMNSWCKESLQSQLRRENRNSW